MPIDRLDIRPGVSMLAVLRHLNYKPWYALSEFVDNSVESFTRHRSELEAVDRHSLKLRVSIDVDTTAPARITIRDNAAGIFESEYARAFRPAALPPERNGLAEFGMGMKSAACWFAPRWSVRTSALGEPVARTVHFDIADIVEDDIEELEIVVAAEEADLHYTEVVLEDVFQVPMGRTVGKLKEHLADIYRAFIRDGDLELKFNREVLSYSPPAILKAPYFRDPTGAGVKWLKPIEFEFGKGLAVHGFAALRERANTSKAGFALFRRGRVIEGSGDEGYRPQFIFGSSNSYRYQRLFGELHLDGFDVSHTKDGFRWDESEQPFLELLREHLDSAEMPLLKQAEGYRVRVSRKQMTTSATQAVANTAQILQAQLPAVLPRVAATAPVGTPEVRERGPATVASRSFEIRFHDRNWLIDVALSDDPGESQWLAVSDSGEAGAEPRQMSINVSMAHPFMVRFAQGASEDLEAILRVAAAIAVAEVLARDGGVRLAATVRRNVNEILTEALSGP